MSAPHGGSESKRPHLSRKMYAAIVLPLIGLLAVGVFSTLYFAPWKHPTAAHASSTITLGGHVPQLIGKSQLLGPTDPNTPITLLIGLKVRDQVGLEAYVSQMQQSHSVTYMTPDQIAKTYAPLPSSQQSITSYLQLAGFSVTNTYKHHLLLTAKGTIGQAESAFNVQVNNYHAPSGHIFYAPSSDPSVPDALGGMIQSISGLDTTTTSQYGHPPITLGNSGQLQTAVSPNTTNCLPQSNATSNFYLLPSQIAQIYNLNGIYNQHYHGEGQSVALFELADYLPADIAAYTACFGGGSVPINRILVSGGTGKPLDATAAETELDMELVLSAAPNLAQLDVYEAPNSGIGLLAEWSQIVSDAVPVVSTSWGACEPLMTQAFAQEENTLFAVAAAQGQTILAASGDSGTNDCAGQSTLKTETVDDPASQPFVTSVGGTSLSTTNNTSFTEQAWSTNNGTSPNGSGGGVSAFWTMPSWQQGVVNAGQGSSTTACAANTGNTGKYCREVPDVALDADPASGYPIYYSVTADNRGSAPYTWLQIAGTSAAAPMWAAMVALANQMQVSHGSFNLGFLNPYLYQIGLGNATTYNSSFHDIKSGNNATFTQGKYSAGNGYDMVTGWGSYNAAALAAALGTVASSQQGTRTSVANTTWYLAEGSVGNGFQEYLTLLNPSLQAATVSITYLFESSPSLTVQHTVAPSSRSTVSVNADVGVALTAPQKALSAIVQSNIPIVTERPMYFNLHGIASGTDVVGATKATQTSFYFAEGDTRQDATHTYYTYVTMLNPSTSQSANVSVSYISNGSVVGTQTVVIPPLHRGTATPAALGLHQQVAIKVTSDIGIVVERPLYFKDNIPTAGGWTTGAASTVGATSLGTNAGSDYLFAEGYTGTHNDFQEYLVLANFSTAAVTASVKLEYANGTIQTVSVPVAALSQTYFDVNNAFSHPVAGCNCTPTPTVSAEVTAPTASLVAERLMYFHFGSTQVSGGTDVMGEAGPASHLVYAFAEGYTYTNFSEFLTLQNPNNNAVTVAITLFADNTIVQQMKLLPAHSRTTVSINSLIVPMATAYPTNPVTQGFEVSMDVQSLGGSIIAERPLYFNWHGDVGGTDVLGYTGG